MLITHAKPTNLWGKRVYDAEGRLLGQVVAIGSRRGVIRRVVIQASPYDRRVRLASLSDTSVDSNVVTPRRLRAGRPWLRIVH